MLRHLFWVSAVAVFSFQAVADTASGEAHGHGSKYAGQENRAIKSLSADDIAELRRGGGWGLAKAAELNGVPGPAHLLELKDEIPLTPAQVAEITGLYESMRAGAIAGGERLIALEQALETHFRDGTVTDAILRDSLDAIAAARRDLRYTHLATHLKTPKILTPQQVARYAELRGYAANPCDSVPAGHSAEMWKKHNGCN